MTDTPSITCPQCGMTSYHPKDVEHRYCGNCHQYHDMMQPPRVISRWGEGKTRRKALIQQLTERSDDVLGKLVREECHTTKEFAALTGHSEELLTQKAREGWYFTVLWKDKLYWPTFQTPKPAANFDYVLEYLRSRGYSQWTILLFWLTTTGDKTNYEWLEEGQVGRVMREASILLEQGAK